MRRLGIFASLLFLLCCSPSLVSARAVPACAAVAALDELPWQVVDAVLKQVVLETEYAYSALVEWYSDALLTVEQSGSSYVVRILDANGGVVDMVLIDDL